MASFSPKDKHNFQCVTEASLELIKLPLKDILLNQIKPEDLFIKIRSSSLLSGRNKLRQDQLNLCYFPPPVLPDYSKFDVTLLYTLIRNVCPGLQPTRGWGNEPSPNDTTIGDDIERLRLFRNRSFAHRSSASISDDTFEDLWKTLKSVFNRLKSQPGCTVDYEQELIEIKRSKFTYDKWDTCKTLLNAYMKIEEQTDEREVALVEPSIWMKGKEEVICGDTAEFDAEVKQTENFCLPIIWQRRKGKAVEIIDTNLEKYSGSTNTKLVIPSVRKEDAWEYQASVSRESNGNRITVLSNTIYLHVFGEMPFLNDLKVTTEDEGITIHYSFGVSENSPQVKNIIWSKNGQPMYIKYDKFIGGSLHDSFLVIKSPSEDDKGKYACTVTNAVGSKTKDIVLGVPCVAISIKPTVHFASKASITSIVTSMPPPEKAQWQNSKNGNNFSELDVTKSKYFGSNVSPECPLLVIPKTTFDDNLYYRLQISNKLGVNVSNIVNLKVTGSLPNISISHETDIINRSIKLSGAVFLSDDSPGIQDVFWSKNGEKIDIQGSGGRLSGVTIDDPSLTIRDVSQEDVGKYQLTARNAIGTNTSDVISIDAPYLNIRSEKNGTEKNDCICFTVDITSIPSPCYAQWNAKSKEDETFTPLDVNAEEYEGSTNSLPHPMLVVIKKGQLEKNMYQIEVSNFVGSTVKEVSGDQSKPVQEREENKLYRTTDADAKIRFANLCNSLAMQFPPEKLKHLKKLIHDTEQVEDLESLLAANSAMDCFLILQNEKLFTRDDVIFMQYLCKQTQCGELYQKCKEYALNYKALCFIEIPPDNGYKEVQIHLQANLACYDGKEIKKIVEIVAAMLDCKPKDILVVDIRPSRSVILVLSIKEEYTWKFSALNKEDSQKLRRLEIDYLIVDKKTIFLETSTEMSRKRSGTNVPRGPNPKNSKNLSRHIISQTEVPNEVQQEVPPRFSEYNWYRKPDDAANIGFAKLNNYLGINFPHKKFQYLKRILLDTKKVENVERLNAANNAGECFSILQDENLFTPNDVILMQFLCKETQCDDLYKECINYAITHKALCFTQNPPDNGYKKVQIYIQDDFRSLAGEEIQEIVKIIAAILNCNQDDILVVGVYPSGSVILVLSVKEKYAWKFTALNEEDSQKLRRLKVDHIIVDEKTILLESSTEISQRKPFHTIDETCSQYRVHQCSKCPGDIEYYCVSCPCDLCPQCKENHVKDLKTIDHNVVSHLDQIKDIPSQEICAKHPSHVYIKYCEPCQVPICFHCRKHRTHRQLDVNTTFKTKREQHKRTIQTIRSEALFYRPLLMPRIKADFDTCHTEFSLCKSEMLTKAHKLKHHIDKVNNVFCNFDFKHRCLSQKLEINRHIVSLQRYVHRYEQSAFSALKFLSSIKTCHSQIHFTLHTSQLSMPESHKKKDVIESLSAIQITERGNRRVRNEFLLKLMSSAEFHQSLKVTGVDSCFHISCVTSDRVWVSDENNRLILINTTGVPLHHVEDLSDDYTGGLHTVNSESELIYIDMYYYIIKLSKDLKTVTTFIEETDYSWKPRCVYWSPSTGDLLVGMRRFITYKGKVTRYNQSGKLIQTIQHDNTGLELYREPKYITENNNCDVVVSDFDAVVVTELGGRHRFSYTGHPSGSELRPLGICTDPLSHILVCDNLTETVQMLDRDGQFLSHLLIRPSGIFSPCCLSYDINTHHLWVGSWHNKVCVYRYITQQDALTDKNKLHADDDDALSSSTPDVEWK